MTFSIPALVANPNTIPLNAPIVLKYTNGVKKEVRYQGLDSQSASNIVFVATTTFRLHETSLAIVTYNPKE